MNQMTPATQKAWAQDFSIATFNGKSITMKPADIPRLLKCEKATIAECVLFLRQCQQYGADPFMRDMYIIKYGNKDAAIVTGVGFFQKKAQCNPKFEGFCSTEWLSAKAKKWVQCWIPSLHGATPLGCRVSCHVKGYREKQTFTVNWEENKKDTNVWRSMPSRMIEKVAMVGLLRQTFPADFAGLYIQEEIDGNIDTGTPTVQPASRAFQEPPVNENLRVTDSQNKETPADEPILIVEDAVIETPEKEIIQEPVNTPSGEKVDYPSYENTPDDPGLFGNGNNEVQKVEEDEIPF